MEDVKIYVPLWRRYTLTVDEAAAYFHIGSNKLRVLAEEHADDGFVLMNGNRILFKRQQFEDFLSNATII